jgi:hypothetical protein
VRWESFDLFLIDSLLRYHTKVDLPRSVAGGQFKNLDPKSPDILMTAFNDDGSMNYLPAQ